MVQTFLGESARTAQFVKDFLDHRRPFWQLHRERRDQAFNPTVLNASSTGQKLIDKKKRSLMDQDQLNSTNSNLVISNQVKLNNSNSTGINCTNLSDADRQMNVRKSNSSVCNGLNLTKTTDHFSSTDSNQDNQVELKIILYCFILC